MFFCSSYALKSPLSGVMIVTMYVWPSTSLNALPVQNRKWPKPGGLGVFCGAYLAGRPKYGKLPKGALEMEPN